MSWRRAVVLGLVVNGAAVAAVTDELDEARAGFDHRALGALLEKYVDDDGRVDYEGLARDGERLDAYLDALSNVSLERLGRDEKLALLINAYNAFTLRLILDHYPVESIRDIPAAKRWEDRRWNVGGHVWSLDQIENEQIRPKFKEPRIHFALVCAAVGCPPLRDEAYTGSRLDEQLADQARRVHHDQRWFRFDRQHNVVSLTRLYEWYGGDFEQAAGSVLAYAAAYAPPLKQALEAETPPEIRWLEYDWSLNDKKRHHP